MHLGREEATHIAFVVTAGVSALVVFLCFTRWAVFFLFRFFCNTHPPLADRLAAGIWAKSLGAVVISIFSIYHIFGWHYSLWLVCFAWGIIILAYFLHITAWGEAYLGLTSRVAGIYAVFLAIVFAATFAIFL